MADADGHAGRQGRFEELSIQECRELLGTTTVGRVGFASSSGQLILPVNFSFLGGAVIFRTAATGPLAELASGADDVAFEVDYHGTRSRRAWSVLLNGSAAVVDADEVSILTGDPAQQVEPWAEGERDLLIRLSPRTITGRRVSRPD
jgi:nitroimidazol reductase NimA-like FMN-containing flavoprotein (pyridoxamine 5'-phosphate oxidase superfamily)